jgi:Zn ribbon nucleic-acid-binding protein
MSNLLILSKDSKQSINSQKLKRFQKTKMVRILSPSEGSGLTTCPCPHSYWLQRNRIDAPDVCPSVSVMKQIELKEEKKLALLLCQWCGAPMRLIGSEPHPVEAKTDLLTYCCTACDDFLVLPTKSGAHT